MDGIIISRFELFESEDNYYSYRFTANDYKIFKSRGYKTVEECLAGIRKIKKSASLESLYHRNMIGPRFFFNLRSSDNESLGVSEIFNTEEDMNAAIALIKYEAGSAPVLDRINKAKAD